MNQNPEKCLICQQTKEKFIYNLNKPICSDCWKDPLALKKTPTPEIVQITEKLFLGNADAQIDKSYLQSLGISHIVTISISKYLTFPLKTSRNIFPRSSTLSRKVKKHSFTVCKVNLVAAVWCCLT